MILNEIYRYRAYVTKVYDGDTITVDIDLGFDIIYKNQVVRLARINTPEIKGDYKEDGLKSRKFLASMILNKNIIIQTTKDKKEKYGRYLAEIILINDLGGEININNLLVESGLAKFQEY